MSETKALTEKLAEIAARPTLQQMATGTDGWLCPRCGCQDWRVVDSRWSDAGRRRQRVCRHCKHVFHSLEVPVDPPAEPEQEE